MKKIAILASHNGSGFDAIYKAIQHKQLNLQIVLLITNNTNSVSLQKASQREIPSFVINRKKYNDVDKQIYTLLEEYKCTTIFLSGYMKQLSPLLTQNFQIINAHPSLLPKYGGVGMYGKFVHEAVIANKELISGVTIHEVNEVYDNGKILLQKSLLLEENETVESLEKKIKELEGLAIVEALQNV